MPRKRIPSNILNEVLLRSRRRCAICFGLNFDTKISRGQIAHIDQDNNNSDFENLVFLCFNHHDEYDSTTRQSKGITCGEVKHFRDELYTYIQTEKNVLWTDYPEVKESFETSERQLLSLEVYERKIQIYRITKQFLGVILAEATATTEQISQFARDTDEAIFLFDRELAEYLRMLNKKAARLYATHERLDNQYLPVGDERSKLAEENGEILMWFTEQFEIMREYFYKHIALG